MRCFRLLSSLPCVGIVVLLTYFRTVLYFGETSELNLSAMAKTVKHLDGKVSDLQVYFEAELNKFRTELKTIKTPDPPCSGDDKLESLFLKFSLFEATVNTTMQALQNDVKDLKLRYDRLNLALDNNIQEAHMGKLLLYGVPEKDREDVIAEMSNTIKLKLNISLNETDVIACYRYGKKKTDNSFHRPIFIHFADLRKRGEVFSNKKRLKGTKLVVAELLSPLRYEIYKAAKQKVGGGRCWSNGGRVGFCWNGRAHHVTTMKHFLDICK